MTTREIAGFILFPVTLLIAAWVINRYSLWSNLGNFTVPWFCSTLAMSVLIVGVTSFLLQQSPAKISKRQARWVIAGVLLVVGIGMLGDAITYNYPPDGLASLGEWIGFAVILCGVFSLSRDSASTTDA